MNQRAVTNPKNSNSVSFPFRSGKSSKEHSNSSDFGLTDTRSLMAGIDYNFESFEVGNQQMGKYGSHPLRNSNHAIPTDERHYPGAPLIQTKLRISQPNDKFEKEADGMADRVISMPEPALQRKCYDCEDEEEVLQKKSLFSQVTPLLQRQEEEEEEEEELLQAKPEGSKSIKNDSMLNSLHSGVGAGQPLEAKTRSFMESRFGVDFSDVRIHTNSKAALMNKNLNAQAFTYGRNIYFNSGKFNPQQNPGKHLLAHELTHVIQQNTKNRGLIMKKNNEGNKETATRENEKLDAVRWRNYIQGQIGRVKNLYLIALVNASAAWSPPPKHTNLLDYFMDDLKEELAKFVLGKIPYVSDAASLIGAVASAAGKVEGRSVKETISSFKQEFKTICSKAFEKLAEPTNPFSVKLKDKIINTLSSNPTWNVSTPSDSAVDNMQQKVKDMVNENFYGNKNADFSKITAEITNYMNKYWEYYLLVQLEIKKAWRKCKAAEWEKGADSDACTHYIPPRSLNECWSWSDSKMSKICAHTLTYPPMPPGWSIKSQKWLVNMQGVGVEVSMVSATGKEYVSKSEFETYKKRFQE